MPGAESLGGLVYQQRYVHFRVLSQLALQAIGPNAAPHIVKFSVEGWTRENGPVWDIIFEFSDGMWELHECKDTAIAKEDRLIFYDRLRRQIAAGTPAEKIRPIWVTDPDKQTPNALKNLEGMAATIDTVDLSQLVVESRSEEMESVLQTLFPRTQNSVVRLRSRLKLTSVRSALRGGFLASEVEFAVAVLMLVVAPWASHSKWTTAKPFIGMDCKLRLHEIIAPFRFAIQKQRPFWVLRFEV